MGDLFLEAFRRGQMPGIEAFNRGDWVQAFAGLPENFEFHPDPSVPDWRVLRGRTEMIRYFQSARDSFPDWRNDPQEYIDAGGGTVVVRSLLGGVGKVSGLEVRQEVFYVYETENGIPIRMREFFDRRHAFEAVGLTLAADSAGA
jgi:ketosteroid isomerase-like protein